LLDRVDRWRRPIFALIVVTYLAGFNGLWQIEPDSGLYLTLGRNLATGLGYTYRGAPHALAYPGFPLALAGLCRLFPAHLILAADGLILLCALASLALTYRLIDLAYDRATAIVVTGGVAVAHEFYRYSYEILTDMPFLMGVMAVLAGHEAIFHRRHGKPRWWDWALLAGGLAVVITTRPTMIGLLAAWMTAMLCTTLRQRKWGAALAGTLLGLIAISLFLFFDPRRIAGAGPAGDYERGAFSVLTHGFWRWMSVEGAANVKDLFGLTAARAMFGMPLGTWWLNAIFGAVVLAGGVALLGERLLWGLWVILTLVMLVVLMSHDRYFVQILPLMVLGWWRILRRVNLRLPARAGNYLFGLLLLLGVGPNAVLVADVILHQHEKPFLAYYKEGRFPAYVEMAQALPKYTSPHDTVLCPMKFSRAMTFLSDRWVYEMNEPIPAEPNHLFVILDPADADYRRWLEQQGIVMVGQPLASKSRVGGKPPICLTRANRAEILIQH
jgi:hypothetical protein